MTKTSKLSKTMKSSKKQKIIFFLNRIASENFYLKIKKFTVIKNADNIVH